MQKFVKGDDVIVIAGKDKGKKAVVLERINDAQLLVEGVNVVKKHQKANPMKGIAGGVSNKTMPIQQSNISHYDKETGKPSRVRIENKEGKKVRVLVSTGAQVAR